MSPQRLLESATLKPLPIATNTMNKVSKFFHPVFAFILFNLLISGCSSEKVHFSPCPERETMSKDVKIEVAGCGQSERCTLHRGHNTSLSITFTPVMASIKGIERVFTGKFTSSFHGKTLDVPVLKPIDAGNETVRLKDKVSVNKVKIRSYRTYLTNFTYVAPVTSAKGPFDLRLILREKVIGTKSWKLNPGILYVCAMIPFQYA